MEQTGFSDDQRRSEIKSNPLAIPGMPITLHDRTFRPFISSKSIAARVREMGMQITRDYEALNPLFVAVLNGSFIFAADLFREIKITAEISFVKLSSYEATHSSGAVTTELSPGKNISGRHVVVIEDIIDTGNTLNSFLPALTRLNPASVKIATLLIKPEALRHDISASYTGFEIPDLFVAGYGLDYNGLGRNLPEIYQVT
jgi:hypoxanthine phosphoribosyltransferase